MSQKQLFVLKVTQISTILPHLFPLVWERESKLLADKIELLLKNETLRKEMGEKARKFAQGFGMEKYVSELLSVYKS
jgi:hypothetical protein